MAPKWQSCHSRAFQQEPQAGPHDTKMRPVARRRAISTDPRECPREAVGVLEDHGTKLDSQTAGTDVMDPTGQPSRQLGVRGSPPGCQVRGGESSSPDDQVLTMFHLQKGRLATFINLADLSGLGVPKNPLLLERRSPHGWTERRPVSASDRKRKQDGKTCQRLPSIHFERRARSRKHSSGTARRLMRQGVRQRRPASRTGAHLSRRPGAIAPAPRSTRSGCADPAARPKAEASGCAGRASGHRQSAAALQAG